MAVTAEMPEAKKAMAVVTEVTTMETAQCLSVDERRTSTWPSGLRLGSSFCRFQNRTRMKVSSAPTPEIETTDM